MEQFCDRLALKIQIWCMRGVLKKIERSVLQYHTEKIERKREALEFKGEIEEWKKYLERVKRRTRLLERVAREAKGESEEAELGVEVERDVQEVEVKRSIEVEREIDLKTDLEEVGRGIEMLQAELDKVVMDTERSTRDLEEAVEDVLGSNRDLMEVETDATEVERDEEVIRYIERSKEEFEGAMRDVWGLKKDPMEVIRDEQERLNREANETVNDILWWEEYLDEVKRDAEEAKRDVEEAKSDLQELHTKFHIGIGTVTVRVFNAETGPGDNIKYPLSLAGNPDLPVTHEQLANLTAPGCDAASRALGRPALPPDMPVAQRRQRIGNYLGVSL